MLNILNNTDTIYCVLLKPIEYINLGKPNNVRIAGDDLPAPGIFSGDKTGETNCGVGGFSRNKVTEAYG